MTSRSLSCRISDLLLPTGGLSDKPNKCPISCVIVLFRGLFPEAHFRELICIVAPMVSLVEEITCDVVRPNQQSSL